MNKNEKKFFYNSCSKKFLSESLKIISPTLPLFLDEIITKKCFPIDIELKNYTYNCKDKVSFFKLVLT